MFKKGHITSLLIVIIILLSLVGTIVFLTVKSGPVRPKASTPTYGDEFSTSPLDSSWQFDNPSTQASYEIISGNLKLTAAGGDDQWTGVNKAPKILKVERISPWSVETKVTTNNGSDSSLAGIVVYKDALNWFVWGQLGNQKLEASGIINNNFTNPVGVMDTKYSYLRVRRVGNSYYFDASVDGVNWTNANVWQDTSSALEGARYGFMAKNWGGTPYSVQFDYFKEYDTDLMSSALYSVVSTSSIAKEIGSVYPGDPPVSNNTAPVDICGTDLGSMFDWSGKTYSVFGDTSKCPLSGINIDRSSTLAFTSDQNPTDGISFDGWIKSGTRAKELFGDDPGVITSIPTYGVGVGSTAYLFYMQVTNWTPWTCNGSSIATSQDGSQWTKKNLSISWAAGNFNQVAIVHEAPYLYIWGIPCGRSGSVKLMRVNEGNILNKNAYEYFAGYDNSSNPQWNMGNEASAVTVSGGPVGEISVIYNPWLGRYIMTYLEDYSGKLVIRESQKPWGFWSAPQTITTSAAYPALYAAFMKSGYWENNGETMYFRMSQFFPRYSTYWMKTKLVKSAIASPTPTSMPTNSPLPEDSFKTEYFNNADFTNKVLERIEPVAKINSGRSDSVPVSELTADGIFSVKWEGNITFSGKQVRFNTNPSSGKVKVFLDGVQINDGTAQQNAISAPSAGMHIVKYEYIKDDPSKTYAFTANIVETLNCFDMNGDGRINAGDQSVQSNHYGVLGETPWDINNDLRVNAGDEALMSNRYGKTCPHDPAPPAS